MFEVKKMGNTPGKSSDIINHYFSIHDKLIILDLPKKFLSEAETEYILLHLDFVP